MSLLDGIDLPILQFTTSFVGRFPLFDHVLHAISRVDSFKGVPILALFWYAWFVVPPDATAEAAQARRRHLVAVLAGSVATVILSRILQLLLHVHQRPILAGLGLNFPDFISPAEVNPWNSFPSDHSMLFFALATGLWRLDRRLGLITYLWAAIVIDFPRLYLGLHYPSDILVGSLLGVLCMLGFLRLGLDSVWAWILAWGEQHRAWFYTLAFLVTEQVAHLFYDIRLVSYLAFGHVVQS